MQTSTLNQAVTTKSKLQYIIMDIYYHEATIN